MRTKQFFKITRQKFDIQNFQKVLRHWRKFSASLENSLEVENHFLPWFNRSEITASIKTMLKVPFASAGMSPQTYWKHCSLFWPHWSYTYLLYKSVWPYKVWGIYKFLCWGGDNNRWGFKENCCVWNYLAWRSRMNTESCQEPSPVSVWAELLDLPQQQPGTHRQFHWCSTSLKACAKGRAVSQRCKGTADLLLPQLSSQETGISVLQLLVKPPAWGFS